MEKRQLEELLEEAKQFFGNYKNEIGESIKHEEGVAN